MQISCPPCRAPEWSVTSGLHYCFGLLSLSERKAHMLLMFFCFGENLMMETTMMDIVGQQASRST